MGYGKEFLATSWQLPEEQGSQRMKLQTYAQLVGLFVCSEESMMAVGGIDKICMHTVMHIHTVHIYL